MNGMWKDFSSGYIKNNRSSSLSILTAALICALFLSFLCSLFYNLWSYEVTGIILEEGDWQGRLTGDIDQKDLDDIQNYGNVKHAVVNESLSGAATAVVDITFHNARTIYEDMPRLTELLDLEEDAASYHSLLLSNYLIHDPQDQNPPLVVLFYVIILCMVSLSLILIIRNSFAMSMDERLRQFGILSSIGATPKQIRTCLMQEAAVLCAVPILIGSLLGIALSFGAGQAMDMIAAKVPGRHALRFQYHALVLAASILSAALTVLCSAWLPARKLSKITPLEAIRGTGELRLNQKKRSCLLSLLFGIEGELAGNALRARRKALRTSTLSLTFSFLGFSMVLNFFTLSGISTRYTYFERYQDAWDVMTTIKDRDITDLNPDLVRELNLLANVQDCVMYQKAEAFSLIPQEEISRELMAMGGPTALAGADLFMENGSWLLTSPVIILDDAAFTAYCKDIGIKPRLDAAVVLNQIWDSQNSSFRYPDYLPYVKEQQQTIRLRNGEQEEKTVEIPVAAYTRKVPVLREEYPDSDYGLVQFIPLSLWSQIWEQMGGTSPHTYIRILADGEAALGKLNSIEKDVARLLGQTYEVETENRIQERITNDYIIWGYKMILGGLCCLLALIGIANVCSNTLSFMRQRRRELAQYMSIGMTPSGIRNMFCIEALVIAGRPLVITLPLTAAAMGYMIKASYLDPMEFIAEAPILPMILFYCAIFISVALAYYAGGKRMAGCSLAQALRDDTMT